VHALKANGIAAIVAKSYARIFYRNGINNGLLLLIAPAEFIDSISESDRLELTNTQIVNHTKHASAPVSIPPLMKRLRDAGGILNFLKTHKIEELEAVH
jgi:3-isopropylmalate/(R)-2-methylmalate dehydratase small subunit